MFKNWVFLRQQRIRREARYWDQWKCAGREPRLSAMIDDPIVRLLMERDGVSPADVWRIIKVTRRGLGVGVGVSERHATTWNAGIPASKDLVALRSGQRERKHQTAAP